MALILAEQGLENVLKNLLPEAVQIAPIGRAEELERLPQGRVVAVVASKGQAEALKQALGSLWTQEVLEFAQGEEAALLGALAARLFSLEEAAQKRIGALQSETAAQRREALLLNTRLREFEHFLYGIGNPHFLRAYEAQPQTELLSLHSGQIVRQRLPFEGVGTTALDLFLPDLAAQKLSGLKVSLLSDSGAEMQLSPQEEGWRDMSGWLRFWAETPLQAFGEDATLEITWQGEAPVQLGLAYAQPDTRFSAQIEGEAHLRGLALQVWKTAAHLPIPPAARGALQTRQNEETRFVLKRPSELPKPALLHKPAQAPDYTAAEYWARENAFLIHPSVQGAVCGVLRDVSVQNLTYVSAQVMVGHEQSCPLNFALGVVPAGEGDLYPLRQLGPWLTGLPAGGWGQVVAALPRPITGKVDLLLAASAVSQKNADKSWALFRSFRFAEAL